MTGLDSLPIRSTERLGMCEQTTAGQTCFTKPGMVGGSDRKDITVFSACPGHLPVPV